MAGHVSFDSTIVRGGSCEACTVLKFSNLQHCFLILPFLITSKTFSMVNNAGMGVEGVKIHELEEEMWDKMMWVMTLSPVPLRILVC